MTFRDHETDPYLPRNRAPDAVNETVYHFVVKGAGSFPLDMLRYDNAWACTLVDYRNRSVLDQPERVVICATHDRHAPTEGRWQSFGWSSD